MSLISVQYFPAYLLLIRRKEKNSLNFLKKFRQSGDEALCLINERGDDESHNDYDGKKACDERDDEGDGA